VGASSRPTGSAALSGTIGQRLSFSVSGFRLYPLFLRVAAQQLLWIALLQHAVGVAKRVLAGRRGALALLALAAVVLAALLAPDVDRGFAESVRALVRTATAALQLPPSSQAYRGSEELLKGEAAAGWARQLVGLFLAVLPTMDELWLNQFGHDGPSVRGLLLLPVRPEQLLLARTLGMARIQASRAAVALAPLVVECRPPLYEVAWGLAAHRLSGPDGGPPADVRGSGPGLQGGRSARGVGAGARPLAGARGDGGRVRRPPAPPRGARDGSP
jgi:hypothetical protein